MNKEVRGSDKFVAYCATVPKVTRDQERRMRLKGAKKNQKLISALTEHFCEQVNYDQDDDPADVTSGVQREFGKGDVYELSPVEIKID